MTRLIWPLVVLAFITFSLWLLVGPFPHLAEAQVGKGIVIGLVGLAILATWANRK